MINFCFVFISWLTLFCIYLRTIPGYCQARYPYRMVFVSLPLEENRTFYIGRHDLIYNLLYSAAGYGPFHIHYRYELCWLLKTLLWCRTAIKELFLYFNLCLSVMLDSLLCSFTFISILTSTIVAIKIFPFFFSSLSLSKIWSYHSINFEVSVLMSIFSLNMVMHQHIKQVHQWSNLISISPCHIFLKKHKAKH